MQPLPPKLPASSSTSPSASHSASERLSSIQRHMSKGAMATSFTAEKVPQAPEDPLFGLMAAFRKDTFDKKVDLGIGAYRDNNAKPWVLPVVKKVSNMLDNRILSRNPANRVTYRLMTTSVQIQTLITSTYQSPVSQNLPALLKSSY